MVSDGNVPECRTKVDVEAHDHEHVLLVGKYQQVDMNAHPRRGPEYVGHVGVQLEDTLVHLGPTWDSDSRRPEEEIERLEGERVRGIGTIHEEMIPPPNEQFTFVGPCLHPVERIEKLSGVE